MGNNYTCLGELGGGGGVQANKMPFFQKMCTKKRTHALNV